MANSSSLHPCLALAGPCSLPSPPARVAPVGVRAHAGTLPVRGLAAPDASTSISRRRVSGSKPLLCCRALPSPLLGRPLAAPAHSQPRLLWAHRRAPPRTSSLWIDNQAEVVADIPVDEAYKLWEDRERIPRWMPWIASVKVQPNQPELSRWTLRWDAFGQNVEVNWMARNMQPVPNQKIHWRSVDGLPNRGIVRFFKAGQSSTKLEMTISYEVPGFLLPFATAVGPLVESIIKADLDRFAVYAKEHGHSLK